MCALEQVCAPVISYRARSAVQLFRLIYLSPDLPSIQPDHRLRSGEIEFAELGLTREETPDRLNLRYLRHAIWVLIWSLLSAVD